MKLWVEIGPAWIIAGQVPSADSADAREVATANAFLAVGSSAHPSRGRSKGAVHLVNSARLLTLRQSLGFARDMAQGRLSAAGIPPNEPTTDPPLSLAL